MYYPSNENKGADQLRGYGKKTVFSRRGSYKNGDEKNFKHLQTTKVLISLIVCCHDGMIAQAGFYIPNLKTDLVSRLDSNVGRPVCFRPEWKPIDKVSP